MSDFNRTHNNTRFWDVIAHEYPSEVDGMRASENYPGGPIDLHLYVALPLAEHDDLDLPPYAAECEERRQEPSARDTDEGEWV